MSYTIDFKPPEIPTEELDDSPSLTDLLNLAVAKKTRMTLTFQNKVLVAIVPLAEVELIKKIENTFECVNKVPSESCTNPPDCLQV